MMRYSDEVLSRYYSEQYVGSLDEKEPTVYTGQIGTSQSGEVVRLQMQINKDGVIEKIVFKAHGSCATIAAATFVCEQLHGKNKSKIDNLTPEQIVEALQLPKVKIHSALLAIDACRKVMLLS